MLERRTRSSVHVFVDTSQRMAGPKLRLPMGETSLLDGDQSELPFSIQTVSISSNLIDLLHISVPCLFGSAFDIRGLLKR